MAEGHSVPTVIAAHSPVRRRRWSRDPPPDLRDLRIVLLGKNVSENSRVGNFLLGRAAFDSEAPPDVVERVGGRLKDRYVSVINVPQLLQPDLSLRQITQTVRKCVNLSDPGPHVVVLVLKHEQCSAEDQECVEKVLDFFSERAYQHTMVLSTQETNETNDILQKIIQKCFNRHFSLQRSSSPNDLLQTFEDIVQMNDGRHLDCAEASQYFTMEKQATESFSEGVKLNLVVCGSDGKLKSSISERILQQTDRKLDVELHGCLINLMELKALSQLSEEDVICQSCHCVSFCDPGVHVFLLIIPDFPLTDEDKAEMEAIQRIFSSRINKHIMIIIMQNSELQTAELNEETQSVIDSFGKHNFFGPTTQVSTLMENIKQMVKENRGDFFSTETFLEVQMKKLLQFEEMKKKIHSFETNFLLPGSIERQDELRIILLGKTGVGRSSTGNTILGREAFTAELSQESITKESQRESSDLNGRCVTVIDTPGLFDTKLTTEEVQREISNCISMILPGPHAFIIVLNLGQRFTQEEATSVKIIQEMFGKNALMFTMVLFTRGDDLKNKTIDQCLGEPGSPLRNLMEECRNRFHVFNNNQTGDRTQVSDLLEKIDAMVKANGGSFYSCKMFRQMEREKQEQQMKILMERIREREEMVDKLEEQKERMKMMMEEERQYQDKERKRREDEDKKRWEKEKQLYDEQYLILKNEMEGIIREKEKVERDRLMQLEDLENRVREERNMKEDQQKTLEETLKLIEEQHEEELKRRRITSAANIGEIICQKLKEPIERHVYKKTARDLTDEMRTNCESLNGNRSNLEKYILKTLAEEEDFDKYMNYIHYPRDHFKSFIREEVSRYIIDQFNVSVIPKMKENIKVLQQKIMKAAHESTEHVQVNRGDAGLWLKRFTQQLSDELIFSEKDLSGVKQDDVDFNLLEDVITQELTAIMSDISSRFNTKTFPVNLDYTFRPDELLIDHFCQCCWVQCPFCKATCTNTIENHDGDHSVAFHRVNGINGIYYSPKQNLCADICTNIVASSQDFNTPDGQFKYREYRRAGGVYAKWSITPDLFELPYWKWFVCRFQKDLEKHYKKTFVRSGKIQDEWRRYSKQDAIESLDRYI